MNCRLFHIKIYMTNSICLNKYCEGVNVGEMNMLLLKKIEELTLYMIEAKKIEALNKKVETLESNK